MQSKLITITINQFLAKCSLISLILNILPWRKNSLLILEAKETKTIGKTHANQEEAAKYLEVLLSTKHGWRTKKRVKGTVSKKLKIPLQINGEASCWIFSFSSILKEGSCIFSNSFKKNSPRRNRCGYLPLILIEKGPSNCDLIELSLALYI